MKQRIQEHITFLYQQLASVVFSSYTAAGRNPFYQKHYDKLGILLLILLLFYNGYTLENIKAQDSGSQKYSSIDSVGYESEKNVKEILYLESIVKWDKEVINIELSVPIKKLELQTRYYVSSVIDSNFSVWLYDSMKNLQVNSQQTLEDFWGRGSFKNPYTFFKTILKRKYAVFRSDLKGFRAAYQVDLVPNLMKIWAGDTFESEELAPAILNQNATEFTGLIIYSASKIPVRGESYVLGNQRPALFPRIYDENLRLIMSYRNVNKNILLSQGMLGYDVKENLDMYKELVGDFPMRILVRELFGTARTDMIINNTDAKAILANPFIRSALKEGRILVLLENEINQTLYSGKLRSAL